MTGSSTRVERRLAALSHRSTDRDVRIVNAVAHQRVLTAVHVEKLFVVMLYEASWRHG